MQYTSIRDSYDNEILIQELQTKGFLFLNNISEDTHMNLLNSIGYLVPQQEAIRYEVSFEQQFNNYYFSKSSNAIGPHTEFPFKKLPPNYLVLFCLTNANCGGGQTYICNIEPFIQSLSDNSKKLLMESTISFVANTDKNLQTIFKNESADFPILETKPNLLFRFSHNLFYYGDTNAQLSDKLTIKNKKIQPNIKVKQSIKDIIIDIVDYYEENKMMINMMPNSILIWNNHKFLHGRNSFNDLKRKLFRYFIDIKN